MPSARLELVASDAALSDEYLWYSKGNVLHRRHLKTHVDAVARVYAQHIWRIQTTDKQCIVAINNNDGCTLWSDAKDPIAMRVGFWIATPSRVVYAVDGDIWSHDFKTTRIETNGTLLGASDQRILYHDYHRKWEDGTEAESVKHLSPNGDVFLWTESVHDPQRPYWLRVMNGAVRIGCDSRTAIRLERLLKQHLTQLLNHA